MQVAQPFHKINDAFDMPQYIAYFKKKASPNRVDASTLYLRRIP